MLYLIIPVTSFYALFKICFRLNYGWNLGAFLTLSINIIVNDWESCLSQISNLSSPTWYAWHTDGFWLFQHGAWGSTDTKMFQPAHVPPNVGRRIYDENRMSRGAPLNPVCESCQCVNSNLIRGMAIKWARSRIGRQWHGMMGAVPIIQGNSYLLPGYLAQSLWRANTDTPAHLHPATHWY